MRTEADVLCDFSAALAAVVYKRRRFGSLFLPVRAVSKR